MDYAAEGSRGRTWRAGRSDLRLHMLSVISLSVAFLCLATSLLVLHNLANVRDRWARAGRATVYLRDGASDGEVTALAAALQATKGVRRVRHITSAEARREVVVDEHDKALAALPAAAFPASLEVGFTDEMTDDAVTATTLKLRALPVVESVETYQRWTARLSSLLSGGVAASLGLAVVVLAAVIGVVSATMRLVLHRRRSEVEVLQLVGATDAFVRRPFIVEGAAQGAAGAACAIVLLGAAFLAVRSGFDQELGSLLGVSPMFIPWHLSLGTVLLGGLLGSVAARLSLRNLVRA